MIDSEIKCSFIKDCCWKKLVEVLECPTVVKLYGSTLCQITGKSNPGPESGGLVLSSLQDNKISGSWMFKIKSYKL